MFKTILSLASKLLTLFMWWKKKQNDPVTQIQNERQTFQKGVVSGDESSVNSTLRQELDRLRDKDATGNGSK